jgi:hypothetical protein
MNLDKRERERDRKERAKEVAFKPLKFMAISIFRLKFKKEKSIPF